MKEFSQKKLKEWQGKNAKLRQERKQYMGSPSAGPGILKIYKEQVEKALKNKQDSKIIVLGNTPELRDLGIKYADQSFVVDFNPNIIYFDTPKESIIKTNWLDVLLKDKIAELIVGDGALANIQYSEQDKFFREMHRLLKPKGRLILRDCIMPTTPKKSAEEVIKDHYKHKRHWFDLILGLYMDSESGYDPKKKCYVLKKIFTEKNKKLIKSKDYQTIIKWKSDLTHYFVTRHQLDKLIKPYFKLKKIIEPKDYYFCRIFKFIILEKK